MIGMDKLFKFRVHPANDITAENMRHISLPQTSQQRTRYPPNVVCNQKYTLFTFLPLNLWEQFHRFMNQYFLLIAILQLVPTLTPVSPLTTWFPLLFIFGLSAVKEAFDDYHRWRSDKLCNNRLVDTLFGERLSGDLCVGDIVRVSEGQEIPCDLVLLQTSAESGECFIQTANIDGETDLKPKSTLPVLNLADLGLLEATFNVPQPDQHIHAFDSSVVIGSLEYSLDFKQLLLQGTFLRNTDHVYGLVVYTGSDTKLSLNKRDIITKVTRLDRRVDLVSRFIFVFQLALVCLFGLVGNLTALHRLGSHWYLENSSLARWFDYLVIPGRMLLLFSFMIPISLKVSLDIVKYFSSLFIQWDRGMFDDATSEPAVVTNTAISDELGQLHVVFSDKTGTLTENQMIFKRCSVGNDVFGGDAFAELAGDPRLSVLLRDLSTRPDLDMFFTCLALNHTLTPVTSNSESSSIPTYRGQSPDEESLVGTTAKLGYVFLGKAMDSVTLRKNCSLRAYTMLKVLEFTSERKRMSVIAREESSGQIFLFTKGADDVMFDLCVKNDTFFKTRNNVELFAQLGYRTLCLGFKKLSSDEFEAWNKAYEAANLSLDTRESLVMNTYETIEKGLEILGSTAIEDRLQDRVPGTIQLLRAAGIRLWVLTGDKRATAVQIGKSCGLLLPETQEKHLHLDAYGKSTAQMKAMLDEYLFSVGSLGSPSIGLNRSAWPVSEQPRSFSLIVDGQSLRTILDDPACASSFTDLGLLAKTVVCCRVSPLQKSQVVSLVKSRGLVTLAIGDGGNDVSMIQTAHVGVGIKGREGLQASRAADYSIAKFCFLSRLILIHGRYSYKRTAFVALFCFYKSMLIGFLQALFEFYCGFSGTSFLTSYSLSSYNIFFTGLPIIFYVMDKDIKESSVFRFPEIYLENITGKFFSNTTCIAWIFRAIFQSFIVLAFTVAFFSTGKSSAAGFAPDLLLMSFVAYSCVIWIQTVTLTLASNAINVLNATIIVGSLLLYHALTIVSSMIAPFDMSLNGLFRDGTFWAVVLLTSVVATLPFIYGKFLLTNYMPRHFEKIQLDEIAERNADGGMNLELRRNSGDASFSTTGSNSDRPILGRQT